MKFNVDLKESVPYEEVFYVHVLGTIKYYKYFLSSNPLHAMWFVYK